MVGATPIPISFYSSLPPRLPTLRYLDKFVELDWDPFGTFAFAVGFATQTPDETVFRESILTPILGEAGALHAPRMRRLWFEGFTMIASDQ